MYTNRYFVDRRVYPEFARSSASQSEERIVPIRSFGRYFEPYDLACNYESKSNRKSQSSFVCVRCGLKGHADYIAALNILMAVGHTASACGDIKSIAA